MTNRNIKFNLYLMYVFQITYFRMKIKMSPEEQDACFCLSHHDMVLLFNAKELEMYTQMQYWG